MAVTDRALFGASLGLQSGVSRTRSLEWSVLVLDVLLDDRQVLTATQFAHDGVVVDADVAHRVMRVLAT
ncbi:MAG: hypothetical protein WCG47_28555 [Dermatophilaceae bacterium]